jgi:ABC-type uncharacterized transport system substrate-binding protein
MHKWVSFKRCGGVKVGGSRGKPVRRREFISASALLLFARAGLAQGARKIVRIGYLSPAASRTPADAAFEDALRAHGWIADQNIRIDYRYSAGQQDSTAALADEIIGLDPDVIVVWGPAFALAVNKHRSGTPTQMTAMR